MSERNQEALAILLLRLGAGWFLFVWAVHKILLPKQYNSIWKNFHGMDIGETVAIAIGVIQIIVCICIFVGYQRIYSYAIGFLIHGFTTLALIQRLIDPWKINDKGTFPPNRNTVIVVAALSAFAAIWLLRHRDHWSLDVWLKSRKNGSGHSSEGREQ